MGVFKTSPKVDPAVIAALQQQLNADPRLQNFQFAHVNGGRVADPNAKSTLAKQILGRQLPDGYDVDQDGQIVYTNKTPALQQLAWASTPFVAGEVASGLAGAAGGAGAAGAGSAGASAATGTAAAGGGAAAAGGAAVAGGSSLADYFLKYGLPIAGSLIGTGLQIKSNNAATAAQTDYLNKALEQAKAEQEYQHGQDALTRATSLEQEGYARNKYAEATNVSRRNYGDFVQTLEPYRAAGTTATERLASLIGRPNAPYTGGNYYDLARDASTPVTLPASTPGAWTGGDTTTAATPAPKLTTMPVGQPTPTVTLLAPTGERQQFAANDPQVALHISRGAVRIA